MRRISELLASPRLRFGFLALFPVALAAGLLIQHRSVSNALGGFRVDTDRDRAIAASREFLKTQGVDTTGWEALAGTFPDIALYRYVRSKPSAERMRLRATVPISPVEVMFRSPNGRRRASVTLSFDNKVKGYDLTAADLKIPAGDPSYDEAMRFAEQVLNSDPQMAENFGLSHPEVANLDRTAMGVTRKYTWHAPLREAPEVDAEFSVAVRNGHVLSRSYRGKLDPALARRLGRSESFLDIFGDIWLMFVISVAIYSVITYVRRAMQKEVSHSRMILIAILISTMFSLVSVAGRDDWLLRMSSPSLAPLFTIYTAVILSTLCVGILIGIGYCSGEGEVREAYPGKLTSLDALVLGKLFSRNVGASILFGAAFGGWVMLVQALLLSPIQDPGSSQSLNGLKAPFMHMPALWFILSHPVLVLVITVGGLLQPIAFANRVLRKSRFRLWVMVGIAAFCTAGSAVPYGSFAGFLAATATQTAALVLPFFAFDLLAAITSLTALQAFDSAIRFSLLFPSWNVLLIELSALGLVILIAAAAASRWGKVYKEEDVRPEYARHIAERQSLQAEVSAAREAQLRLLPQASPKVPGLSVHASCLPARVVGGDFYDFFPLSNNRLGVFIAEGGNRSFASALSLALAKGYLMHTTQGPYSPTEVIQRLETTLGRLIESGVVRATIAYAVIDPAKSTIRYARTGTYPKVIVAGRDRSSPQLEREVAAPYEGHPHSIHEGSAHLSAGDSIVLYTDGVANRIARRTAAAEEDWVWKVAQDQRDAKGLCFNLLESLGANPEKHSGELEDDLTAIVIHCTETGAAAMEVVA